MYFMLGCVRFVFNFGARGRLGPHVNVTDIGDACYFVCVHVISIGFNVYESIFCRFDTHVAQPHGYKVNEIKNDMIGHWYLSEAFYE